MEGVRVFFAEGFAPFFEESLLLVFQVVVIL